MAERPIEFGLVLPAFEDPGTGEAPRWETIRRRAQFAEDAGFDTVWVPDELLWKVESWGGPRGFWEGVALLGAVAAVTSRANVGSWVLSALHRNPGLTVKAAETLDEVSGGRFIFGFGAGHSGTQGAMFGYPPDKVVGRYEEALEIVVGLLEAGEADLHGEYHRASEQVLRPRGPRPGEMPLMLGGHGPRTIGLAVKYADIWSAYGTDSSLPPAFAERIELVDRACEDQGRDPASLGRSVGVVVDFSDDGLAESWGFGAAIPGTDDDLAEAVEGFIELGVDMLEFMLVPDTDESAEDLAEILDDLDS